jgi:uncharacterized protein YqgV (UPF0045/DUF77 family)
VPAPPAEVVAEFTIQPFVEGRMEAHVAAGVEAARASGLAVEVGPFGTGLAGARAEVLEALTRVMEAAIEAGARSIHVKLQVPSQTR